MDNYTFGNCRHCNKCRPLKNGICLDCKNDIPDFLKDLFKGK